MREAGRGVRGWDSRIEGAWDAVAVAKQALVELMYVKRGDRKGGAESVSRAVGETEPTGVTGKGGSWGTKEKASIDRSTSEYEGDRALLCFGITIFSITLFLAV